MAEVWGVVAMAKDKEVDGLNLSDSQLGYGESTASTCIDVWDLFHLEKLFKSSNEGKKSMKKFDTTRYT